MAGVDGLEPTNDGIKTRCLTTWLYPNNVPKNISKAFQKLFKVISLMVRKERLELSRREALEPKSSVSTNSTTPAYFYPIPSKSGGYSGTRTCDPIIMSDVL